MKNELYVLKKKRFPFFLVKVRWNIAFYPKSPEEIMKIYTGQIFSEQEDKRDSHIHLAKIYLLKHLQLPDEITVGRSPFLQGAILLGEKDTKGANKG